MRQIIESIILQHTTFTSNELAGMCDFEIACIGESITNALDAGEYDGRKSKLETIAFFLVAGAGALIIRLILISLLNSGIL